MNKKVDNLYKGDSQKENCNKIVKIILLEVLNGLQKLNKGDHVEKYEIYQNGDCSKNTFPI